MRPRGLGASWKRFTPTYGDEVSQPARAAELAEALACEATAEAGGAPSCPRCGSAVAYDLACHTFARKDADGRERWVAHMSCDSAITYMCDNPGKEGEDWDDGCGWEYKHGINPLSPDAAANEERRPPWLPLPFDGNAVPGCRLFGTDWVSKS